MLWGNPPKWPESQSKTENRKEEERCQAGRLVISTLINDSKLPLNNLTLKTERGLARRVPVWVLSGPLGCLEYKERIRISKRNAVFFQNGLSLRTYCPITSMSFKNLNQSCGWLIFKTSPTQDDGQVYQSIFRHCWINFFFIIQFSTRHHRPVKYQTPRGALYLSASTSWQVLREIASLSLREHLCDLMQFGLLWPVQDFGPFCCSIIMTKLFS